MVYPATAAAAPRPPPPTVQSQRDDHQPDENDSPAASATSAPDAVTEAASRGAAFAWLPWTQAWRRRSPS